MPEDLMLPGIDPAPAAGGDTPAAPTPQASDDTATQSASVDTGAQAPPADPATEPVDAPEKREARGVQKRINELVERERRAEARAEQTQTLLQQVLQGVLSPQQARGNAPAAEAPPKEGDYSTWQEFNAAQVRYEARQAVRQEFEQATRFANENQQRAQQAYQVHQHETAKQQLHGVVQNQMQEAATKFPDYIDVVGNADIEVPLNVEAAMAISGAGGEVAYYLARNPQLIPRLAQLPDLALATQVARIANAMRSGSYSVSNAPPPGRPSGGRGSGPSDYPKDATPEQHLAWTKRQAAARR